MDFNENLKVRYHSLTKQSKKIADYIKTDPTTAVHMTAKALGDASGTSAASVIRFSRAMGYEGLEPLKIHLAQTLNALELAQPLEPLTDDRTQLDELGDILYSVTSGALEDTLALLNRDEYKKGVELLRHAKTIYLFGIGASALAAQDLFHKLNRIGKPSIYMADGHSNLEFASTVTKKDLVIAISYSGETKEVYLAAQRASANGAPVIAITRARSSTLSSSSTITYRLPETEKRIRTGAFSSKFSQIFVTDLLYLGLIHEDYDRYCELLVDTSQIVRGLKE